MAWVRITCVGRIPLPAWIRVRVTLCDLWQNPYPFTEGTLTQQQPQWWPLALTSPTSQWHEGMATQMTTSTQWQWQWWCRRQWQCNGNDNRQQQWPLLSPLTHFAMTWGHGNGNDNSNDDDDPHPPPSPTPQQHKGMSTQCWRNGNNDNDNSPSPSPSATLQQQTHS